MIQNLFDCATRFDDSISSTVSTDASSKNALSNPEATTNKRSRGRRVVQFAEHNNMFHESTVVLTVADRRNLWYTSKAFNEFRDLNEYFAERMAECEEDDIDNKDSYGNVLLRNYVVCCSPPSAQTADLLDKYKAELTDSFQCKGSFLRIGLECRIVDPICLDMQYRREELQDVVRDMMVSYLSGECTLDDDFTEELCQMCEDRSKQSRLFAQQLAQAQLEAE